MNVALFAFTFTPAFSFSTCKVTFKKHAGSQTSINDCQIVGSKQWHTLGGLGCPGSNELSHLIVEGPCQVDLYSEEFYGGEHIRFEQIGGINEYWGEDDHDFENDHFSSVQVYQQPWSSFGFGCPSGQYSVNGECTSCRVTFSENFAHRSGQWCDKALGDSLPNFMGGCPGNNKLSYVRIDGDCMVKLYSGSAYTGQIWHLPGTQGTNFAANTYFTNDVVSSFKIVSGRRLDEDEAVDRVEAVVELDDAEDYTHGGVFHMNPKMVEELEKLPHLLPEASSAKFIVKPVSETVEKLTEDASELVVKKPASDAVATPALKRLLRDAEAAKDSSEE